MALYIISYDISDEKNYKVMYDELQKFNAIPVLESTWCFKRFDTTTTALRDHFKKVIGEKDSLFINETKNWASFNCKNNPKDLK